MPNRAETEEDQLMIEHIEALAKDIQARIESLSQSVRELDGRVERLESGESGNNSSESPDRSAERREMFRNYLGFLKQKNPKGEDYWVLRKNPPRCISCQHATLTDGSVMQPTGDKAPDYLYSGFVDCARIIGQPMPLRTAPIRHCMHRTYDEGGVIRVPKEDSSQG